VENALSWHFPSRLGNDFDSSLSLCGFVNGPLNGPKGALPKRFLTAHLEISVERPAQQHQPQNAEMVKYKQIIYNIMHQSQQKKVAEQGPVIYLGHDITGSGKYSRSAEEPACHRVSLLPLFIDSLSRLSEAKQWCPSLF
jgi:hypothetical protein